MPIELIKAYIHLKIVTKLFMMDVKPILSTTAMLVVKNALNALLM